MAVTVSVYNNFKKIQFNGNAVTLGTSTMVALATSSYTPALTHTTYTDFSSAEVANGNGYTTGGVALSNPAFSGTTTQVFDADDTTWTFTASKTARYAVIYDITSSAAIAYLDFGSDQTTSSTFTIVWNGSGIVNITSS